MRYIDPNLIDQCKPVNWDANARVWTQRVQNAADKSGEIKKVGSKWSDFKPNFIREFGDKCWYSEVPRIGTDFDVDHFRPKGDVKISKQSYATRVVQGKKLKHPGYWWLAFEAKNYRYACIEANRPRANGGKHDYFPLMDEETRVWNPCNIAGHGNEDVKLLDPCCLTDVALVSYVQLPGAVMSRYSDVTHPDEYSRVRESAKRYNLNSKTIKGARNEVIKKVNQSLEFMELHASLPPEQQIAMNGFLATMEQNLVDACSRKSAFSATAVAFVRQKRHEAWLAHLLPRLDLSD
ncbi:hypothetical protein ACA877_003580 [Vibrio alginolyticus]|uniref:hypothetical protein n=1 Tax=Vibrio parahaemolyticus TaxID=670 RepID=UPI0011249EF7|nr:hypothetical protein [Vibrio parahaemolyticus]ELA8077883.1 hypothetical protein [Vibrio alginolyticus]HDY7835053.1 hypothetical protein [Vibrio vulnificus]EGQ8540261.1 hypothetical protein [Vibrio parahaemolyticus]EIJ2224171.1 hypothetical protein [Vibrio parahaemolyticus]EJG1842304.1 hypothetical protein [Vibrio parahaemolyticus]